MISKLYEKADFQIIEFSVEDVLAVSSVVHTTKPNTTAPSTTLPGTTSGGIHLGPGGNGDAEFEYSDLFQ